MLDPKKVRSFRLKRKLTMPQAASLAKINDRQSWYRLETTLRPGLTLVTAMNVAKALGVKIDQLLKR